MVSGSLTLQDLMVQDTGLYEDPKEQIVMGLPFTEEIPADSPIQVNGTPTIVDDGVRTGMEFDSAEDYLIIPAAPSNDLTHDGTIEAWLTQESSTRGRTSIGPTRATPSNTTGTDASCWQ